MLRSCNPFADIRNKVRSSLLFSSLHWIVGEKQRPSRPWLQPLLKIPFSSFDLCDKAENQCQYRMTVWEALLHSSHPTETFGGCFLLEWYKGFATRETTRILSVIFGFEDTVTFCYTKIILIFVWKLLSKFAKTFYTSCSECQLPDHRLPCLSFLF